MRRTPHIVVGFAAETNDLIQNARSKLEHKRLDLIVANPVPQTFGSDNVKATLLFKNSEELDLEPMPKEKLAEVIFDRLEQITSSRPINQIAKMKQPCAIAQGCFDFQIF